MAPTRCRRARAPVRSWCCSDRSAPGTATAWCCAMRRRRARWPVAMCSIRSPRCATAARRNAWRCCRRRALPRAAARLTAVLAASAMGDRPAALGCAPKGFAATRLPPPTPQALLAMSEGQPAWALDAQAVAAAQAAVLAALRAYHQRQEEELGPDAARLRRLALPKMPEPLWRALLARWLAQGDVKQRGAFVHLPEHGIKLSAAEERIAQKVAPALAAAGFEGAGCATWRATAGESEALMRTTLARLAQRGELHQVVKDLFYPPATIHQLAAIAREVGADAAGGRRCRGHRGEVSRRHATGPQACDPGAGVFRSCGPAAPRRRRAPAAQRHRCVQGVGVMFAPAMEGKPSWWMGRASNPVGGAMRCWVGSTPIPLRQASRHGARSASLGARS